LRALTALVAALALAGAATAATPAERSVAKTLKTAMQKFYKAKGSADVFTTVACTIGRAQMAATCNASFTNRSAGTRGVFVVKVTSSNWRAMSVTCHSLKTGKALKC
jgi:hypothetical protein